MTKAKSSVRYSPQFKMELIELTEKGVAYKTIVKKFSKKYPEHKLSASPQGIEGSERRLYQLIGNMKKRGEYAMLKKSKNGTSKKSTKKDTSFVDELFVALNSLRADGISFRECHEVLEEQFPGKQIPSPCTLGKMVKNGHGNGGSKRDPLYHLIARDGNGLERVTMLVPRSKIQRIFGEAL